MVFGDVVHIKPGFVVRRNQPESVLILIMERASGAVHMIEDAEFHAVPRVRPMVRALLR